MAVDAIVDIANNTLGFFIKLIFFDMNPGGLIEPPYDPIIKSVNRGLLFYENPGQLPWLEVYKNMLFFLRTWMGHRAITRRTYLIRIFP